MSQVASFSLEFSESEWAALSQLSGAAGLTVEQYARLKLFEQDSHFNAVAEFERQAVILAEIANKVELVYQISYFYGRKLAVNPEEFRNFVAALKQRVEQGNLPSY